MEKYRFENPEIFKINKEIGHTISMPYADEKSALKENESEFYQSLNGSWKFEWTMGMKNQIEDFEKIDFDDSSWRSISVPSVWQTQGYSVPYYYASTFPKAISRSKSKIPYINKRMQEIGYYRKTFEISKKWDGRELFLHFGAVKSAIEVYINGDFVGYSQGSMTPHEFDITKFVKIGTNIVSAKVFRYCDGTYLEDQDMWWLCGIYRDVYIYAESKICLRDFFFKTEFDGDFSKSNVSLNVFFNNYLLKKTSINFSAKLINDKNKKEIEICKASMDCSIGSNVFTFEKQVINPELWSAEKPNTYTLIMTVCQGKYITVVKRQTVGFKKVEIKGEKIFFNGMPLFIRGVNRHDFDPDKGWNVPKERYLQDFELMKKANINAIRTSHYPDDPYFYELCNKFGFYVMDECEVESHGVRRKGVPGSNPKWTGAVVDRMERMVLRDRNNPCIFMWSLGNEAGDGTNFAKMKEAALKLDDTRQFHYEGDFDLTKSDVISRMYPTADIMQKLGNKEPITISFFDNIANQLAADSKPLSAEMYEGKPVLLCEYAHSMENSLGNFQEYMDDFEKYDNMCGGFIWDFEDQALHRVSANGEDLWLYGSDFAKFEPKRRFGFPNTTALSGSNTYFCANGIIGADRKPHPQYYEVKKVYAPLKVLSVNSENGSFKIKNKMLFTNADEFQCNWQIKADGNLIMKGILGCVDCPPLSEVSVNIPYSQADIPNGPQVVLTISFTTLNDSDIVKAGYEIAWDQFVLRERTQPKPPVDEGDLDFSQKGKKVTINNDYFSMEIFDGKVVSWIIDSKQRIKSPLCPQYFRALTDNDIDFYNFVPAIIPLNPYYRWQKATKRTKSVKTVAFAGDDNCVEVHISMYTSGLKNSLITYKVYPNGRLYVYHSAIPTRNMIKFGYQMALSGKSEFVTWYGRGPHPTYCDRKTGAKIDRYSATVAELEHRYMRPQESSNRCDVQNLSICDRDGIGFRIEAYYASSFNFSAYHYKTEDLEKAKHTNEIPYDNTITTLNIDHMQLGVGGDLPGQAFVREPYIMKKGEKQSYSFVIEPLK